MVIQNLGLNTRTDLKYFCTDLSIKGLMAQLGLLLVLIIFAIVNFYLLAEVTFLSFCNRELLKRAVQLNLFLSVNARSLLFATHVKTNFDEFLPFKLICENKLFEQIVPSRCPSLNLEIFIQHDFNIFVCISEKGSIEI